MTNDNKKSNHAGFAEGMAGFGNRLHTAWLRMGGRFYSLGRNVSIHRKSIIGSETSQHIEIGNRVKIGEYTSLEIEQPTVPESGPTVVIEEGCMLYPRVEIKARDRVHLEKDVVVMQEALISNCEGEHESFCEGEIHVGEGSWIGPGAVIVSSAGAVTIGRHCVIHANAVVTKSVPGYSVLSGNPAVVVERYDPEKEKWVRGSAMASIGRS